jgi:transposase-like protein
VTDVPTSPGCAGRQGRAAGELTEMVAGDREKTVITEAGPVEISVPRDRDSSLEPKIVAKRQKRCPAIMRLWENAWA